MTTFANILALLLAAAALYGMQHSTPSYSEILSPVAVPAAQGKPAQTERFVFGVAKVISPANWWLRSSASRAPTPPPENGSSSKRRRRRRTDRCR